MDIFWISSPMYPGGSEVFSCNANALKFLEGVELPPRFHAGDAGSNPSAPVEVLLNNTKWSGKRSDGVIVSPDGTATTEVPLGTGSATELPQLGSTEVWEIINLTADAHPIHLHLVQFQLMNRQMFNLLQWESHTPAQLFLPDPI